jgi:two-component system sensor histidine kinase CreC
VKIRTRIFLAFAILVGLGYYKLVDWMIDDLRPYYLETMEESMIDASTLLSSFMEERLDSSIDTRELSAAMERACRQRFSAEIYAVTKERLNMRVYITDSTGVVLFDSDDGKDEGKDYSQWNDVYLTLKGQYGARTTRLDPEDPSTAILYVASPIKVAEDIVGALTVCKPAESVTLFLEAAKKKIILAGVSAAFAVLLLGFIISTWITSPIQKLTDYAKAVRDGQRVPAPNLGRSEIGELGSAFEEMRDALEGRQYVENYIQTLTHEMKSPLSAIRGAAELLKEDMTPEQRRQFFDNIRTESDRMQDLVDRLLQLSELEKRKGLNDVEEIIVSSLVSELVSSFMPVLSGKHIELSTQKDENAVIKGERFLVRQAVSNMLQNAVDFCPEKGNIGIAVSKTDDHVTIEVWDNGPGIPAYAIEKTFDRFYSLRRPDTGKKSSGLGLTFVREVATLHGGKAEVVNAAGGGARASLTLPTTPTTAVS